jgi:hypothetical protein
MMPRALGIDKNRSADPAKTRSDHHVVTNHTSGPRKINGLCGKKGNQTHRGTQKHSPRLAFSVNICHFALLIGEVPSYSA